MLRSMTPGVLAFVGLALMLSCTQQKAPAKIPSREIDHRERLVIPKSWRSCDIESPKIEGPPTVDKVQTVINEYDRLLVQCNTRLGRVVARVDRYNNGE